IRSGIIRVRAMSCSCRHSAQQAGMTARCSVANVLADCSNTTSERPHEFFDHTGKPTTWRRGTGRRHGKGGRVRDAQEPEPQYMSSTGELIDIERVTISSEGVAPCKRIQSSRLQWRP